MPELAEVEIVKRYLEQHVLGKRRNYIEVDRSGVNRYRKLSRSLGKKL